MMKIVEVIFVTVAACLIASALYIVIEVTLALLHGGM